MRISSTNFEQLIGSYVEIQSDGCNVHGIVYGFDAVLDSLVLITECNPDISFNILNITAIKGIEVQAHHLFATQGLLCKSKQIGRLEHNDNSSNMRDADSVKKFLINFVRIPICAS